MSFLRQAFGREDRSITLRDRDGYGVAGAGYWDDGMRWAAATGSAVTTTRAMRLSAVFACLRLLSEAIATLPLDTFVRQESTRLPYRPRPDYLSFEPPLDDRIEYLGQLMLSLLTDGNAYVATPRDAYGVPVALIVLDPSTVKVSRRRGRRHYEVNGQPVDSTFDLMHIKGMMLPGELTGLSPIGYARETIGVGLAAQDFGRGFFENGATPSSVIEVPEEKTREQAQKIAQLWKETHGADRQGGVGVLAGGAKFAKVTINPDDAQFLETRQFTVPDVARIYGVPPHLIADASNSTSWGSGLAEQNLAFGQFSLRPWIERIESAHTRLLTTHGLPEVFTRLNLDALLRASLSDRYESYATGISHRFIKINEARAFEDLPPVPWGDDPPPAPQEPAGGAA